MKKALFQRKKHPSCHLPLQIHMLEFSSFNNSVDIIKKYIENVNTEIEVIKMFMKYCLQFWSLKNSNSEQNVRMSGETMKVIERFHQQNQNLIQENTSKDAINEILVENHTFDNSSSKLTVSE